MIAPSKPPLRAKRDRASVFYRALPFAACLAFSAAWPVALVRYERAYPTQVAEPNSAAAPATLALALAEPAAAPINLPVPLIEYTPPLTASDRLSNHRH